MAMNGSKEIQKNHHNFLVLLMSFSVLEFFMFALIKHVVTE